MVARVKTQPDYGALEQRVYGLERGIGELSANVNAFISNINQKLDERSKIPWAAFALAFSVITAIGAMAYWPILVQLSDLRDKVGQNISRV